MTKDQHIKNQNHIETMSKNEDGLKKVMNDEELKEYLEGQPDSICRYVKFLNNVRKGHVNIKVFNDGTVLIETDGDELKLNDLFERYFED